MSICTHSRNTALKLGGRLHQERGQSLVEFAMVLPVLVLIILGILYFGRYENYSNQETQLAEQGVRWAAVNNNPGGGTQNLQQYIISQAQPELQKGSSDVTSPLKVWISDLNGNTQGNEIRVCVAASVTFPTPIGAPTATIAQAATMRIEQPDTTSWASANNSSGNPPC